MNKLNSTDLKTALMEYFLMHRGMSANTEMKLWGSYIADVVAVNKNIYFAEVEVKVNKNDLERELIAINCLLNGKNPNNTQASKYSKHRHYMEIESYTEYGVKDCVPNQFYFCVPEELKDMALKGVKNTRYGVMVYNKHKSIIIEKVAKRLHDDKIKDYIFIKFLRKASFEAYKYMSNK